jgi:cytochrome c biogenesis protein CcdA/thiol-disulfide isomerase/thioredoxin
VTLILIGLLGGLITGLSPCILPVLPVVFLGGAQGARRNPSVGTDRTGTRPYLVVLGLAVSFSLFTLFGSLMLSALHLPDDVIRWLGLTVLVLLGIGLIVPRFEQVLERPFQRFPQRRVSNDRGGFVFGLVLGTLYVPCAGPVLAAITVAGATGRVGARTIVLTLAFAVGTALPLLFFALAGRKVAERVRSFRRHQRAISVASGVTMIALAVALTFNLTDAVQRAIPDYTSAVNAALGRGHAARTALGGTSNESLQRCQNELPEELADCGAAPSLVGIQQWLNTPGGAPETIGSLRGDVVLVDFWAYSCINCQREIAHVTAWNAAYATKGLRVIGVHAPEYAFERVPANVAAGAKRLGITYPIAIDNAYGTWDAYHNDSWPAAYLIDATGMVRHVAIGEGDYAGEETLIRTLLKQADPTVMLPKPTQVTDTTPTDPDQTPEMYLGNERADAFVGTQSYGNGTRRFSAPAQLEVDEYALSGSWTVGPESITSGAGSVLVLHYEASKVYLDVGGTGTLTITSGGSSRVQAVSGEPNIYTIASHRTPVRASLSIRLSPGLSAYSFTFG